MSDYISVYQFVKEMNDRIKAAHEWGNKAIERGDMEIKLRAEQAIATFCEASLTARKMPIIDAEPVKHGKWIAYPACLAYDGAYDETHIVCSECGHVWDIMDNDTETFNFCPNCGARMDGDSDA